MVLMLRILAALLLASGFCRPVLAQDQAEKDYLIGCVMAHGYLTDQSGASYATLMARYTAMLGGDVAAAKADITSRLSALVDNIADNRYPNEHTLDSLANDDCTQKFSVAKASLPPMPKMPGHGAKLTPGLFGAFDKAKNCAGIFYHYAYGRSAAFDDMVSVMRMIDPSVSQYRAEARARVEARLFAAVDDVASGENAGTSLFRLDACYDNFGIMPPFLGSSVADTRAKANQLTPQTNAPVWRALILAGHYSLVAKTANSALPNSTDPAEICRPLLRMRQANFRLADAWNWVGNRLRQENPMRRSLLDSSEASAKIAHENTMSTSDTISKCREHGYL